jgi:hypothetical protein
MGLAILIAFAAAGTWIVLGCPGLTRWWIGPRPKEVQSARRAPGDADGPAEAAPRAAVRPAEARSVTLRSEGEGREWHGLSICLDENGDVKIEGQDLGPSVAEWWGEGRTEYEWTIAIGTADVSAYVRCLGGAPGDDVLELVRGCYGRDPGCVSKRFLDEQGIPNDLWSRVGDRD